MITKIRDWWNREPIDLDAEDRKAFAEWDERAKANAHASVSEATTASARTHTR